MASTTEVKGGYEYQQLAAQLANMAAQLAQMRNQMRGYMPSEDQPTRNDVLNAIYKNRPDLQAAYEAKKSTKDKKGKLWTGDPIAFMEDWLKTTAESEVKSDPTAYAKKQGWIAKPGEVPTLEREKFDADKAQAAATLGLSRQQFEQTLALQTAAAATQREQWAAQLGMDKDQFEKTYTLQQQQFEEQRNQAAAQLGLSREQFEWQREYQAQQLGMTKDQFEKQYGLQQRAQTLSEQQAGWGKEQGQAQLALDWASLQAQNKGPGNAFQLWGLQQAAARTQLPQWQQALQSVLQQQGIAPPQGLYGSQGAAGQAAATLAGSVTPPAPATPGAPPVLPPAVLPQQVNAAQWQALTPSGQQGIVGLAGQQGWYEQDWLDQMARMFPKGAGNPNTQYRWY